MKKLSLAACLLAVLIALTLILWMPKAHASSSYYTSNCQGCHGAISTCNGCHAHGAHSSSAKSNINITGTTNKTTYAPGETISVVISGGYRSGWIRAILYDQNMNELARSTGPTGEGGGAGYPITLTAPAPTAAGTYTWNVSWYGNQYDAGSAFFGPRWTPDPNNPNHGQEIVSTNSFTVTPPPAAKIILTPTSLGLSIVTVGSSVTKTTLVQNVGNADLIVSNIARCTGTSTEYAWSPTALPITIPAAGSATLSVIYTPTDAGTDQGCLNVSSNDPATPLAALNVAGTGTTNLIHKIAKLGVFRAGQWYPDTDGNNAWDPGIDPQFNFGFSSDIPVAGDWNGDGKAEIGVYNSAARTWYLDYNGNGIWDDTSTDKSYWFGVAGSIPASGDWNGSGTTKIGVYDPATATWYLDYNGNGTWDGMSTDKSYWFGFSGVIPVTGDWNGDGTTKIGVYDPATNSWYVDYNGNGVWDGTVIDKSYWFGFSGTIPVTGDWNGDGKTKIGVVHENTWFLDLNGNGGWDQGTDGIIPIFGIPGDVPVTGTW